MPRTISGAVGGSSLDGVYGDAGNDYVDGYLGADALAGGTGNDEIWAKDSSRDTIDCGENSGDNDLAHVDLNNLDTLIGSAASGSRASRSPTGFG